MAFNLYPTQNTFGQATSGTTAMPVTGINPMAGLMPLTTQAAASGGNLAGLTESSGTGNWWDDIMSKAFNSTNAQGIQTQGFAGPALGLLQGAGNAIMGMKQYGLAKDQVAEGKRQFEMNYGAQRGLTNASLEDRQRARVASNPGAYASVDDYMAANGIK